MAAVFHQQRLTFIRFNIQGMSTVSSEIIFINHIFYIDHQIISMQRDTPLMLGIEAKAGLVLRKRLPPEPHPQLLCSFLFCYFPEAKATTSAELLTSAPCSNSGPTRNLAPVARAPGRMGNSWYRGQIQSKTLGGFFF